MCFLNESGELTVIMWFQMEVARHEDMCVSSGHGVTDVSVFYYIILFHPFYVLRRAEFPGILRHLRHKDASARRVHNNAWWLF